MPNRQPLISIIVATYNARDTLDKTLESIEAQTYPFKEIIVVDGGSKDGTWDRVEAHSSHIAYKISERDDGIADAYNKGVRAAHGKWIYFLNADDTFVSKTTLADIFTATPIEAKVMVLVGRVLTESGRVFDGRFGWRLLIRNQVHHQGIFYRSEYLRKFPYNTEYRTYGHDHEHNLFIWRQKAPVQYLPINVAVWQRGGISDTASWKQYKLEFKVRHNTVGAIGYPFNFFSLARFWLKRLKLAERSR